MTHAPNNLLAIEEARVEECEPRRVSSYRKLAAAAALTILGCVVVARNGSVRTVPTSFRVGSHPAFVNYEALPVESSLNSNLPLCHADTVAATCKMLNSGQESGKVTIDKLHEYLDASESSVTSFVKKAQIEIWFGSVNCQELCEKTVASFENRQLPATINAGCVLENQCDIQLDSDHLLNTLQAPGQGSAPLLTDKSEIPKTDNRPVQEIMQEAINNLYQDKTFKEIKDAVAIAFKIFPPFPVTFEPSDGTRRLNDGQKTAEEIAFEQQIKTDLPIIAKKVAYALDKVQTWDKKAQDVSVWFMGQKDDQIKHIIISIFQGVLKKINENEVSWILGSKSCEARPAMYGFTATPFERRVWLCQTYMNAEELSKHETIFHELTHLKNMSTADLPSPERAYGYSNIRELARDCEFGKTPDACSYTQRNAESFTFLVFRLNGEYTDENSIDARIQADIKRQVEWAKRNKAKVAAAAGFSMTTIILIVVCICCLCGCCAEGAYEVKQRSKRKKEQEQVGLLPDESESS